MRLGEGAQRAHDVSPHLCSEKVGPCPGLTTPKPTAEETAAVQLALSSEPKSTDY